jgi:hypothetical protein
MESLGLLSKSDFRKIEGFECECTPLLSLCVGIMGSFLLTFFSFSIYLFVLLLYWGYIVTFTKVPTIDHS